ncbi:hypothetical protein [Roseomonas sp. AR75]|uniref:hypothetical protein n=1 Tax=Roseomonas sp. AR75 TaxID=2562311 RepID=UPI0010BFD2AB|nr:hypothetical protein [Roseomonas sp. AR75]
MRSSAKAWRDLPEFARFLVCHAAFGFGLAGVFVVAFLLADPHGAGGVLLTAADHWWPAVALWFFLGLTYACAQIGIATMMLDDPAQRPRGGSRAPAGLIPAMARARRR